MNTAIDMSSDELCQRIQADPHILSPALPLLVRWADYDQTEDFLAYAAEHIRQVATADAVAVLRPVAGNWSTLAQADLDIAPPEELLADALDQDQPLTRHDWSVSPLTPDAAAGKQILLAVHRSALSLPQLAGLAALLSHGCTQLAARYQRQRRIRRLETILQISHQWNQTRQTEPLLVQMAEAATKLLGADRASIFLWDRAHKTLVGRPALGVEGGELRIPDDKGVVGHVVQTGEPQRVDRQQAEQQIDRQVDQQLGYATENILCVPLVGASGARFGAFEMLNKQKGEFTDEDQEGLIELAAHAATALETTHELEQLVLANRRLIDEAADAVQMIGDSPPIEALRSTIRRVADTDLAILLLGENGTGKEVAARLIHYLSPHRAQPFVAVNCAAIPETLLESELFGHEKGAFTDARDTRIGKFELAASGTLFLDEIGDLSLGGQSKLLRALEEKVVVRVGGSKPIPTNTRIIAATNQDLAQMVAEKKFREDLYFRLNVVTLELPPLRDRGDDILLLAEHFVADFCRQAGRKPFTLTAAARKRLRGHAWPGNIRELRNLVERIVYLTNGDKIDADQLEFIISPRASAAMQLPDDTSLNDATIGFQQQFIRRAIERSGGNMSAAATRLGLHRSNLYRKMRQLGMEDH
ncbi:MAG: GAF domain-containing protein [Planctomycetales bacterium]|nr:GAF domain-containing protein [Planctomycetales bacterium]NIM08646.1 GAF domain-containing protein [Planctomycetales bacterium]NIN08114.1 GAF domain-containing protein [Planctomycetales bacterium]NIN77239.1 GAF domain-containing protein [Planctomycetales bacterium]NIO34428.1 GAF domain-containing protein [Planctomycetales bacterium]